MLSKNTRKFLADESGAYTIWSLLWFSIYVAIGGLAVERNDFVSQGLVMPDEGSSQSARDSGDGDSHRIDGSHTSRFDGPTCSTLREH